MMNAKHDEMRRDAIEAIIDTLESGYSDYYCDLHNDVFNTDYYIIGTWQAKEALNEYDVFDAIEKVRDYELGNFGEVYTDITNPEALVNMLYYIIGEEVVSEMCDIEAFDDNWNAYADEETNAAIVSELNDWLN